MAENRIIVQVHWVDHMSYIEEISRRGRDANPFFSLMGIEIGFFGNGRAEIFMQIRPDMLNGVGWLQGGLYCALCDEAMALALFTILDNETSIATISETTTFLQGVHCGRITALAEVVKKRRSLAFMRGHVSSGDGSILSETCASFALMPQKKSPA
jgi:acyl-CoA thioesterase